MPIAKSMALRQSIVACYKKGEKISTLSVKFSVSRKAIYSYINREKEFGEKGLIPNYQNCGKVRPTSSEFIFRAVRCLRCWHPSWGAEKIHAEIHQMRPDLKLPHHRTFNRWFHWNNQLEVQPKSKMPKTTSKQANALHEIWQIDAKEEMRISNGTKHCWLNITDEYSGASIAPCVFSL